jgi:fucose permease
MMFFKENSKKVNKTARMVYIGVQTTHHVYMCSVLFSLAQPENENKAQAKHQEIVSDGKLKVGRVTIFTITTNEQFWRRLQLHRVSPGVEKGRHQ